MSEASFIGQGLAKNVFQAQGDSQKDVFVWIRYKKDRFLTISLHDFDGSCGGLQYSLEQRAGSDSQCVDVVRRIAGPIGITALA